MFEIELTDVAELVFRLLLLLLVLMVMSLLALLPVNDEPFLSRLLIAAA